MPSDTDRVRLDRFLADQPEVGTRAAAKRLLEDGQVEVGGEVIQKAGHALRPGERVSFAKPVEEEPDLDALAAERAKWALRVLFEDPYLLVIDKQPGLVVHPPTHGRGARSTRSVSVAQLAAARCEDLPVLAGEDRPGIVHRLDKDTSGVMVLAKTDEAFHFLKSQFKARTVHKQYRAIAFGEPRFDSDLIDRNIAVHPAQGDRMTVVKDGGKTATTFYEVVERFRGLTDFRCKPKTGRTHQIRVHMMSVGHSLVGDRVYRSRNNAQAALPSAAPQPGRQCLHAERLTLKHPRTHEEMQFEAPLPEDMVALLRWLRAERPPR